MVQRHPYYAPGNRTINFKKPSLAKDLNGDTSGRRGGSTPSSIEEKLHETGVDDGTKSRGNAKDPTRGSEETWKEESLGFVQGRGIRIDRYLPDNGVKGRDHTSCTSHV